MATYRHTVIETAHSSTRIKVGVDPYGFDEGWLVAIRQCDGHITCLTEDIPDLIAALREHGAECERRNGTATKPTLEFTQDGDYGWQAPSFINDDGDSFHWRIIVEDDGLFSIRATDSELTTDNPPFSTYAEAVAWCNAREAELFAAAKEQPVQE